MAELRRQYRDQLATLEDRILLMGNQAQRMLDDAMRALADRDRDAAHAVLRAEERIDALYRAVQDGVFTALALQGPVATELRLVAALIHCDLHLKRIGGLCVNIAHAALQDAEQETDPEMVAQLRDMGIHAGRAIGKTLEAFTRRDASLARTLPDLDDPIDQLNRAIFRRAVTWAAGDETRLDWVLRMVLVARYLERIGDHAVEIADQTVFVVTGDSRGLDSPPA
jgi:phosphate transport system protein